MSSTPPPPSSNKNLLKKLRKQELESRKKTDEYQRLVEEWRSLPLKKCPYCNFENVYQKSMDHHIRLNSGKNNHPK